MFSVVNAQPLHPAFQLPEPLDLQLEDGCHLALIGPNGGGKTTFGRILAGTLPLRNGNVEYDCPRSGVRFVAFRDAWGDALPTAHQLRWHHGEEVKTPTVREFLHATYTTAQNCSNLLAFQEIASFLDKPIHWLSSGELRKLHLVKALAADTRLAIIDEPYIGLDAEARAEFTSFLARIATTTTLVLLLADECNVPPFVTHVARVENLKIQHFSAYESRKKSVVPDVLNTQNESVETTDNEVVRLNNVSISYFGNPILRNLSWSVRQGERWALTGANGAGKSTLLSLIYADNPMAYACDISVFGQRRGNGGNIWDVKRRIGYVSPEQVRSFTTSQQACDVVASGLSDTGRLHRAATAEERRMAVKWLEALGAQHLSKRDFLTLSEGERRIVLLARAFVKNPDLLILDEPFHGLDSAVSRRAKRLIDDYVHDGRTLIMVSHYPQEYEGLTNHSLHLIKPKNN